MDGDAEPNSTDIKDVAATAVKTRPTNGNVDKAADPANEIDKSKNVHTNWVTKSKYKKQISKMNRQKMHQSITILV